MAPQIPALLPVKMITTRSSAVIDSRNHRNVWVEAYRTQIRMCGFPASGPSRESFARGGIAMDSTPGSPKQEAQW
jgi:hypothetical protein